ncbi:MAG: sugar phosphate isomerase/epimerase [Deltaproteobacteria bacterium]|nr:sugar phosphate isomerase/epimerase [Deltaproteobacteria bacterium]
MSPAPLGPRDLVLCSGTLFGHPLRAKIRAAAEAGYQGITLWPDDVAQARSEGLSDADIRALLADYGQVVVDMDPLLDWTPQARPKPGEAAVSITPEAEFYAIAEAFGARSLNVVQAFGTALDLDRAAEDLAAVCDRARDHGLIVTLEFLPWSGIPNAAIALDLVRRTGRPNATVLVDTWHWFRGGADPALLRALPGDKVGSVQLNDAPKQVAENMMMESMLARLMPGEGDIPIAEVVRILDAIGSQAPLGVEVFHERHAQMDATEVAKRAAEATRRVLAAARG